MKSKSLIVALLIITILSWTLTAYGFTQAYAPVAASFDHSQCQYPNRLSNPPNGCDNTDPANPQCMKFGTETCNIVVETKPLVTPAVITPAAPVATSPVITSCGNK